MKSRIAAGLMLLGIAVEILILAIITGVGSIVAYFVPQLGGFFAQIVSSGAVGIAGVSLMGFFLLISGAAVESRA